MTTSEGTRWLASGVGLIDLRFQGLPKVIASYVLDTDAGLVIVDCGPSSTLPALREGLHALGCALTQVRHLVLTHIHLDHAGAAGSVLRELPDARLYVHEIGAPHMADPANLIRSASRIYGDEMGSLWGAFEPVPVERTTVVSGGDDVRIGQRTLRAIYTPGHASHHLAFHDTDTNTVFAGDVAGIRIPPSDAAIPPTPPPDIDIGAWHLSIDALRDVGPSSLLLAHFGEVTDVRNHLDQLDRQIDDLVRLIQPLAAGGADRDLLVRVLTEHVQSQIAAHSGDDDLASFGLATPYAMSVDGLMRYFRKHRDTPG